MKQLLIDIIGQVSKYNNPNMLDGYLDDIGNEYNSRLTDLGLPTIHVSEEGNLDHIFLEGCIVKYTREQDLIKVYSTDGEIYYLRACIGGHQVGFEVQHCSSNEEVKRLMIDSDGWTADNLGLGNLDRR